MFDTGTLFNQEQDPVIWAGLMILSQLPFWLIAARNPERILDALSRLVPEFLTGQLLLQGVDVGHIRFKNRFWTGLFEVTTSHPGQTGSNTTILEGKIFSPEEIAAIDHPRVEGAFGAQGWQAIIPELNLTLNTQAPEKVLAALTLLTDPQLSREFLTKNIRAASPQYAHLEIQSSNPKVVRYKPGSRCTVLYNLEYAPDKASGSRWPEFVIAKVYRNEKGKNAFEGMQALWNSPLRSSHTVQIAEPIAYVEQDYIMIQGPVREEQTLKKLITSVFKSGTPEAIEELNETLRKTARGLAELHRSNVRFGQAWDWADEFSKTREKIDDFSHTDPGLSEAAHPFLERLDQLAAALPPDPAAPSHGSFRPAQVLLYRDQVGFIDFDSFCQSEPANDLALFLSTVMVLGMTLSDFDEVSDSGATMGAEMRKARFEIASSLCETFLSEYEKYQPVSRERVALWEALDLLMEVLHGWIKVKPGELADVIYTLEQFLIDKKIVTSSTLRE